MDELSQNTLTELLKIAPETLSKDQKAFMKARSSYLTQTEIEVYGKVLGMKQKPADDPKPVSKKALVAFRKELKEKKLTEKDVCATFEVETLEELSPEQFEQVVSQIAEL